MAADIAKTSENKYISKFKKQLAGSNIPLNIVGAISRLNVDMLLLRDSMGYMKFQELEGKAIKEFSDMFYEEYWSPNVENAFEQQWGKLPRILEFANTIESEKQPLTKTQETNLKLFWKNIAGKHGAVNIAYSGKVSGLIRLKERKTERDGKFLTTKLAPIFAYSGLLLIREFTDDAEYLSAVQVKNGGTPQNVPPDMLKSISDGDEDTVEEDEVETVYVGTGIQFQGGKKKTTKG